MADGFSCCAMHKGLLFVFWRWTGAVACAYAITCFYTTITADASARPRVASLKVSYAIRAVLSFNAEVLLCVACAYLRRCWRAHARRCAALWPPLRSLRLGMA